MIKQYWFPIGLALSVLAMVIALSIRICPQAEANPNTPVPIIESAATIFCDSVNANPTAEGVVVGLERATVGMDNMDGAYVLITAIHHTCAQHETLIMDVVGQFAFPDGCKEMA